MGERLFLGMEIEMFLRKGIRCWVTIRTNVYIPSMYLGL